MAIIFYNKFFRSIIANALKTLLPITIKPHKKFIPAALVANVICALIYPARHAPTHHAFAYLFFFVTPFASQTHMYKHIFFYLRTSSKKNKPIPKRSKSKRTAKRHVPRSFACDQKKTALSNLHIIPSYKTILFKVFFYYFRMVNYKGIMLSSPFSFPRHHFTLISITRCALQTVFIFFIFQC